MCIYVYMCKFGLVTVGFDDVDVAGYVWPEEERRVMYPYLDYIANRLCIVYNIYYTEMMSCVHTWTLSW